MKPLGITWFVQCSGEQAAPLDRVAKEMDRQDAKWGQQNHPDGTDHAIWTETAQVYQAINDKASKRGTLKWLNILLEEVFEAAAETDPARLKEELDQVAAVALQWGLSIDRRGEET